MHDFTAEELWNDLRKYQDDEGHDYDYVGNYGFYYKGNYVFDLPGYGPVETIEGQGMHEVVSGEGYFGSSTEWDVYFIVKVQGRYFKFSGVDSSWDSPGIEYAEEVEPVEKVVTVWEKKLDY